MALEIEGLDAPAPEWARTLIARLTDASPKTLTPLRHQSGVQEYRGANAGAQRVFLRLTKGIALERWDHRPAWVIATIFAEHPALHADNGQTLPAALRSALGAGDSTDARLERLIDMDRQELLDALPGLARTLASARRRIDLYRLAWAINEWGLPSQVAQHAWASDAWPPPTPTPKTGMEATA